MSKPYIRTPTLFPDRDLFFYQGLFSSHFTSSKSVIWRTCSHFLVMNRSCLVEWVVNGNVLALQLNSRVHTTKCMFFLPPSYIHGLEGSKIVVSKESTLLHTTLGLLRPKVSCAFWWCQFGISVQLLMWFSSCRNQSVCCCKQSAQIKHLCSQILNVEITITILHSLFRTMLFCTPVSPNNNTIYPFMAWHGQYFRQFQTWKNQAK